MALLQIMPNLEANSYQTKKCIISRTVHGRPYIGESLQKGLYIAGGCNGYSAMCSDAIGNVAAEVVLTGQISNTYQENAFEIIYQ
jgi:sarcosine oxidase